MAARHGGSPFRRLRLRASHAALLALTTLWVLAGPATADTPPHPPPSKPVESATGRSSPLGSYLAGRHAHAQRDYRAAAAHILRAHAADPNSAELLHRAVFLLVADGRIGEALELAPDLLVHDESARLARLLLGLHSARAGDFDRALAHIEKIEPESDLTLLLPIMEGWMHFGAGRQDMALAALERLRERSAYEPFFKFHSGLMHDIAGKPDLSETLFREATASAATWPRPTEALGRLLERTGRTDDARTVYTNYLALEPRTVWAECALARVDASPAGCAAWGARASVTEDSTTPAPLVSDAREGLAEALLGTASVLPRRHGPEAALVYARFAIHLREDLDAARIAVGEILEAAGRPSDAGRVYGQVAPDSPFSWTARLRTAVTLVGLGRLAEATATLRDMADERTERIDALVLLGDSFRGAENYDEAAAAYDEALARAAPAEDRHWALFYARGIALEQLDAWSRAEADFLQALELEPDQPQVLNYLGYSWVIRGHNLEDAKAMLERAVAQRPTDGYIVDSLGWALYRTGDYDGAVRALERATELVADNAVIIDHLGDAYWRVGRRTEARFQWKRALAFDAENDIAEEIRRKLAEGLADGVDGQAAR